MSNEMKREAARDVLTCLAKARSQLRALELGETPGHTAEFHAMNEMHCAEGHFREAIERAGIVEPGEQP